MRESGTSVRAGQDKSPSGRDTSRSAGIAAVRKPDGGIREPGPCGHDKRRRRTPTASGGTEATGDRPGTGRLTRGKAPRPRQKPEGIRRRRGGFPPAPPRRGAATPYGICQNGRPNPCENPVFPGFRPAGRKYGILAKVHFDKKEAIDASRRQTGTGTKPFSSRQEANGRQKSKITFFWQGRLAWGKGGKQEKQSRKTRLPSRPRPVSAPFEAFPEINLSRTENRSQPNDFPFGAENRRNLR